MVTISSRTELSSAASADEVLIEDVSAGTTKKITAGNLTSTAYGFLYNTSVDQGGTAITLTNLSTTYTTISGYSTDGGGSEILRDETVGSLTLPAGAGTYLVQYSLGISRVTGSAVGIFVHVAVDGTHLPGSESLVTSTGGATDFHSQSAESVYVATGGEALVVQAKLASGTTTTAVDQISFIVTRLAY